MTSKRNRSLLRNPAVGFLAGRMRPGGRSAGGRDRVQRLIRLSVPALALSAAVMLCTVSVLTGFKVETKRLLSALTGDVVLSEYGKPFNDLTAQVEAPPEMIRELAALPGVQEVRTVLQSAALVKTDSDYTAVLAFGYRTHWQRRLFAHLLTSGSLPYFSEQDTLYNPILLPQSVGQKLGLRPGDKAHVYFTDQGRMLLRSFTVAGLLALPAANQPIAFVPQNVLRTVQGMPAGHYARLELMLREEASAAQVADEVVQLLTNSPYVEHQTLGCNTAAELNAGIYDWLNMLDSNAYILLALMGLVAAFTIINCLLILILDRTATIGLLKALGMRNASVMELFLRLSLYLIVRGLIPGNIIALGLCLLQYRFRFIPLDPGTYTLSFVPVWVSPWQWIAVNLAIILLCLMLLLLPVRIVSKISPVRSLKFD